MAYFVSVMFAFFGIVFSLLGWIGLRTFHRKQKEKEREKVPWELT
jgi:H+/Cl- antiporter ClcA